MVNNADWLDISTTRFLRDYGSHFTINRMLAFDCVNPTRPRAADHLPRFNYMLLQAYDFLELRRRYGCVLQMGGSDQWGNILNGIELIRRWTAASLRPDHAAAHDPSGAKMGKTRGAIWLNSTCPAIRLLAILAEHRGPGRRPVHAPFHRPATG